MYDNYFIDNKDKIIEKYEAHFYKYNKNHVSLDIDRSVSFEEFAKRHPQDSGGILLTEYKTKKAQCPHCGFICKPLGLGAHTNSVRCLGMRVCCFAMNAGYSNAETIMYNKYTSPFAKNFPSKWIEGAKRRTDYKSPASPGGSYVYPTATTTGHVKAQKNYPQCSGRAKLEMETWYEDWFAKLWIKAVNMHQNIGISIFWPTLPPGGPMVMGTSTAGVVTVPLGSINQTWQISQAPLEEEKKELWQKPPAKLEPYFQELADAKRRRKPLEPVLAGIDIAMDPTS